LWRDTNLSVVMSVFLESQIYEKTGFFPAIF
jgi:hypothetical protein